MPVYSPIRRWMDGAEKARCAERLLALRQKLASEITDRVGRNSLLIATWNLRDFDSNRLGHGARLREAILLYRRDRLRLRRRRTAGGEPQS